MGQYYVRVFNTSDVPLPGAVRVDPMETARDHDCGWSALPVAFEPSAGDPSGQPQLTNVEPVSIVVRSPHGQPNVYLLGVGIQQRPHDPNPERAARLPVGRAGQRVGDGETVEFAAGELVI